MNDLTTEILRQLARAVEAGLPIPETLRNLAEACPDRALADRLGSVAEAVAAGTPLSAGLADHSLIECELELHLLRAGEESDTLDAALREVEGLAAWRTTLARHLRGLLAYPGFAVCFGLLVLSVVLLHFLPTFLDAQAAVIEGRRPVSLIAVPLGGLCAVFGGVGMLLYGWIVFGGDRSRGLLLWIASWVPGLRQVARLHDQARALRCLAAQMRSRTPTAVALGRCADFIDDPALRAGFAGAASACDKGESPADALARPPLDPLVAFLFRHAAEDQLEAELQELSELHRDRAALAARRSLRAMQVWLFLLMLGVTAGIAAILYTSVSGFLRGLGV